MKELKRYKMAGRWSRGGGSWESFMEESQDGEYYKVKDVEKCASCDNEVVYRLCDNCLCDKIFEARNSQKRGSEKTPTNTTKATIALLERWVKSYHDVDAPIAPILSDTKKLLEETAQQ